MSTKKESIYLSGWSRSKTWGFALVAVALLLAAFTEPATAHGRGRRGGRIVVGPRAGLGAYGFWGTPFLSSYYGYPYYGRYAEQAGGLNPALARALGVGALDLDVKPRSAEVFVDGDFVGKVRDFDGYPSYLWLEEGEHVVAIYKGGFATYEQTFDVQRGVITGVKAKMLPGASQAPGLAPGVGKANGPST